MAEDKQPGSGFATFGAILGVIGSGLASLGCLLMLIPVCAICVFIIYVVLTSH